MTENESDVKMAECNGGSGDNNENEIKPENNNEPASDEQKTVQLEILRKCRSVKHGLDALRQEQSSILHSLVATQTAIRREKDPDTSQLSLVEEKASIVRRLLAEAELGVEEATMMSQLAAHLSRLEGERAKSRAQVRRLDAENGWLREELAKCYNKLCDAEQRATKAEEERAHFKFMAELNKSCAESDTESINSESNMASGLFDSQSQLSLTSPDGSHNPDINNSESNAGYEVTAQSMNLTELTDQLELRSVNAEFVIDDFESVRHSTEPLYSRPLYTNGLEFKLKVYPCGNEKSRGLFVSVFLQLSSSVPGHRSSQYTYQVQMKHQSGSVFEREFTSEFEAGKCRGFHLFCPLDRLDQYIENNQLRFIFYVRATSYATQQRNLNNYVEHLEGLIEQQNESDAHETSLLEKTRLEASHNLSIGSQTPHYSSDDEHSEGQVRADTQELEVRRSGRIRKQFEPFDAELIRRKAARNIK